MVSAKAKGMLLVQSILAAYVYQCSKVQQPSICPLRLIGGVCCFCLLECVAPLKKTRKFHSLL